jgi:hypothetical protein
MSERELFKGSGNTPEQKLILYSKKIKDIQKKREGMAMKLKIRVGFVEKCVLDF